MAEHRPDISGQIPEADLLDQQTPIDRQASNDTDLRRDPSGDMIDEADLLEQATPVPGADEDDYPHESPEAAGPYD